MRTNCKKKPPGRKSAAVTKKSAVPKKPNLFSPRFAELLERLVLQGDRQEAFAKASNYRVRRTEVNRLANGGPGGSTVRWIRAIAEAVGVSIDDACAFIEGEIDVDGVLARRGAASLPTAVALPPELTAAMNRFGAARGRVVRASTRASVSALILTRDAAVREPLTEDEWYLLVAEAEGVYDRLLAPRIPAAKVRSK